jgi:CHASE2 domain-containing sensor protein
MRKSLWVRDVSLSTLFVVAVTGLLGLLVINIKVFDPFEKSFRDFELTDIYYSKIRQEQKYVDTNIVLVNIGDLRRDSLALLLNEVNRRQPKVIGLDAFFVDRREPFGDSLLRASMNSCNDLVLAGVLSREGGKQSFVGTHSWFGQKTGTFANLVGNKDNSSTVREFEPSTSEGDTVLSCFAAGIVQLADPASWEKLKARGNEREIIHYYGGAQSFVCLDQTDVFDSLCDLSILKNKVVIMGYLGKHLSSVPDLEDLHFTPMNPHVSGRSEPDMRGVIIHANIVAMILNADYIDPIPFWANWLIAIVLCWVHLAIFLYLYFKHHLWYHFSGKIIQFASSVIIIWLAYLAYEYLGLKFSTLPSVTIILLSMDLLYFYEGFAKFLNKRFGFATVFAASHTPNKK